MSGTGATVAGALTPSNVNAGINIASKAYNVLRKIVPPFFYKHDYYFEEVNQKVFVQKNGNGVVICAFDLYVVKPQKISEFIRGIDITDARSDTKFPDFEIMKKDAFKRTFSGYSFWFKSDDNIITDVTEYYSDSIPGIANSQRDNPRVLGLKFNVNKNKLKAKNKYRVIYGYSVPGLFPVKNGRHDSQDIAKKKYGLHCSSLKVERFSKNLKFAIYLEKGFKFCQEPMGHRVSIVTGSEPESEGCETRDNLFYTKYLYEVKHPEKYVHIYIDWDLQ